MIIRKCLESEIAETGAFYDFVVKWLDEHVNYPRWIYKVYPSEASVRQMTENGSQYICTEDGRIIAAFVLNDVPEGNYRNGKWSRDLPYGSFMILHTLALDPELWGKGIGSEIVRFCIDRAKSGGYKALRIDVVPDNYPAIRLYEKNGFTYAGDADLELGKAHIPYFSLYELNWEDGTGEK